MNTPPTTVRCVLATALLICNAMAYTQAAEPDPTANESRPEIQDIAWLAGNWSGPAFNGTAEETILAQAGGAMAGMFRLRNADNSISFYEFYVIEQEGDRVTMRIHHFSPGLRRWEDSPVRFRLTEAKDLSANFRMINEDGSLGGPLQYRLDSDRLHVEMEIDQGEGPEMLSYILARGEATLEEQESPRPVANDSEFNGPKSGHWGSGVLAQFAVGDLDTAIDFYTNRVGLQLESRDEQIGWARVSTPTRDVSIGLLEIEAVVGSGSTSVNFTVPDAQRSRGILETHGVEFDGPNMTIPGLVIIASFTDPDGNVIRLVQDLEPVEAPGRPE